MRFLLVEDWRSHIYAEPFFHRLKELGHEVHAFREGDYYRPLRLPGLPPRLLKRVADAQHKLRAGPRTTALNIGLLLAVCRLRPDIVFLFRGDQVFPATLRAVRSLGSKIVGWQNDNPYSPRHPSYVWRHFRRGVRHYDHLYAYRPANVTDFLEHGCPSASLLRSFYLRELNHRIQPVEDQRFACDVTFIGHWEPDGREAYVRRLLEQDDLDFRLRGTLWERSRIVDAILAKQGTIPGPVYKSDYNLALNSAKVALVFLSKLNQDTYTRRCFEITACGTFMLSEYSDDLASLFTPGVEAEYFRSADECLEKARFYARAHAERERIATAGYARVQRDGHEALDRARSVASDCLALLRGEKPAS